MEESDLEAAWEREKRRAEVMAERDRCLADAEVHREDLARRQEAGPREAWRAPEPAPVQRALERRAEQPKPAPAPPTPNKVLIPKHDSSGRVVEMAVFEGTTAGAQKSWADYIEQRIGARIHAFAEAMGGGIGEELAEIKRQERARFDTRLVEVEGRLQARLAELEKRLTQIETRAAGGPRLLEAPDAAAD